MARLTRRSFLASSGAAGASLAASPALAQFNNNNTIPIAGTVSIGLVAPFTGDFIRYGEQLGNGVRAAIDDANQLRGTLDKAWQFRTFDDQNLLASGLVNAQFACDDSTLVCTIGHLSGRITDAALKTYVNNGMPLIVPSATYDAITSHGYSTVVRLATKDSSEGRLTARLAETLLKIKSAVVFYQDGDYGLDVAAGFHDQLLADKIASKALNFSWQTPDFAGVSKAAADLKPDIVYLAGTLKDMGGLLPALKTAGYTGPVYASQGFFDAATIQKYPAESEGLTISSSMPPIQLAPADFRIRNNFQQKYGAMTPLSTFAYAATQIVIAAVKRTGANDRIGVARALSYTYPFDTVIGRLNFQNDGDPQDPNVYYYTVKDGAWSYVRAAHRSDFILK